MQKNNAKGESVLFFRAFFGGDRVFSSFFADFSANREKMGKEKFNSFKNSSRENSRKTGRKRNRVGLGAVSTVGRFCFASAQRGKIPYIAFSLRCGDYSTHSVTCQVTKLKIFAKTVAYCVILWYNVSRVRYTGLCFSVFVNFFMK